MTKLPKKVKIGGHMFKIVFKELEDDNGSLDWRTNTITIDSKLPLNHQWATLIHEAFHGFNTTMDTQNDFGHALLDSLSEQFYAFLVDNKILK